MEKIYINLLPNKDNAKSKFHLMILYYIPILRSLILLLGIILILFYIFALFKINSLKTYANRYNHIKPELEKIKILKDKIVQLENSKNEIQLVATPSIFIADIFKDIFESLPQNIWFERLNFRNDILMLKGYVVKLDDEDYMVSLDKFINALRNKDYFKKVFKTINLKSSIKINFSGVDVLNFELECLK